MTTYVVIHCADGGVGGYNTIWPSLSSRTFVQYGSNSVQSLRCTKIDFDSHTNLGQAPTSGTTVEVLDHLPASTPGHAIVVLPCPADSPADINIVVSSGSLLTLGAQTLKCGHMAPPYTSGVGITTGSVAQSSEVFYFLDGIVPSGAPSGGVSGVYVSQMASTFASNVGVIAGVMGLVFVAVALVALGAKLVKRGVR